ncbi:MAG: TM0996/MTH895 family glutaredoxin-like protein [Candidatus Thermoplasmatota archaeon]|nr:TM0996/MTH895 family glutaredoxin-like protein [Candidatus Thermoplasmatota archaeon]MBS3790641.1 TM0996/MTH895 family glutaredoxin-like protein [Candidatus Thermoplasmatota archaeon]
MKIEILGTGCSKCQRLEKNARKAVEELGVDAEIVKVEDISEISERGVMTTPALAIDGEVKAKGKILNPEQIKEQLKN